MSRSFRDELLFFVFSTFEDLLLSSIVLYLFSLLLIVDLVDFPGMMPLFMHIL